jgi:hypothetical protein
MSKQSKLGRLILIFSKGKFLVQYISKTEMVPNGSNIKIQSKMCLFGLKS